MLCQSLQYKLYSEINFIDNFNYYYIFINYNTNKGLIKLVLNPNIVGYFLNLKFVILYSLGTSILCCNRFKLYLQ